MEDQVAYGIVRQMRLTQDLKEILGPITKLDEAVFHRLNGWPAELLASLLEMVKRVVDEAIVYGQSS